MTVQELLVQISTIASIEGEEVAKAEIFIIEENLVSRVLDISYNKERNEITINAVSMEE
jgi:hypothetical protein